MNIPINLPTTESETTFDETLQDFLDLSDALDVDLLVCEKNYRGMNAAIVALCGPDTKAYLQALSRTRELMSEDAELDPD